jgi:hypothetical protein
MIARSGGGNAVILRASDDYLYNETIFKLGKLHSVETLLIDSRDLANHEAAARVICNAEMLFISGGDQSNYAFLAEPGVGGGWKMEFFNCNLSRWCSLLQLSIRVPSIAQKIQVYPCRMDRGH